MVSSHLPLSPSSALSQTVDNPSTLNKGYWSAVNRKFATTQFGNVAAIAAHNCYVESGKDSSENLDLTLRKIKEAELAGADLIELDIKHERNEIYVSHDDDGNTKGAFFLDVLDDRVFVGADRPLYIEIKETKPTSRIIRQILEQVVESGLAKQETQIVFRAFDDRRKNLVLIRSALKQKRFEDLADQVMLHEFIRRDKNQTDREFHSRILQAKKSGFDGVEFRFDAANVMGGINYAKSLGLGVGLFTIPEQFGEVFVAGFREEVDALVVDYPIEKSRRTVEDKNGLIYVDCSNAKKATSKLIYKSDSNDSKEIDFRLPTSPNFQFGAAGHPFFGGALELTKNRYATLYDAENNANEGYYVSVSVGFRETEIADGQLQSIVAKSDSGGFCLELFNPPGAPKTMLRYGVMVGNSYVYATFPAQRLSTDMNHHVIAAYDGDGGVRMWIDGSDKGVAFVNAVGGVVQNDSPIVIGADPQGPKDRRFFFNGLIQKVQVQTWGNH